MRYYSGRLLLFSVLIITSLALSAGAQSSSAAKEPVQGAAAQQQPVDTTVTPVQQDVTPANPVAVPGPADPTAANAVRLGSGDLLEVSVFGMPELKQDVRVNNAGDISFPLIGAIHVEGMTPEQAEQDIQQKMVSGGFLNDPHVSIFVKEYNAQGISVLGEVQKPGIYPPLGARRLYDMISAAGGATMRAGKNVSILRKSRPGEPIVVALSTDATLAARNNLEVLPGDTIVVSKAGLVYVVGDVGRPGGFIMDNNENMTVLQAVALAQGTNRTASLDNAKLIRKSPQGMQEIPIPLKKILAAKSADLPLQPEDIVFVPNSGAKSAAKRGIEAVLQAATGMAVYRR